jgi:hypothetical protein
MRARNILWVLLGLLVLVGVSYVVLVFFATLTYPQDMSNAAGAPFAQRSGETKQPVTVVDSVQMSGGFGTVTFNKISGGGRKTTNPTGSALVFAFFSQRTIDTSATPNRYSYKVLKNSQGEVTGLRVISSQADDSARVDVYAIVK